MKMKFEINSRAFWFDSDEFFDISIPLLFNGQQPNAYGAGKASAIAYESGGLIGDTRRGGSCNFEEYRLIPHCNGTHTECVGHISFGRISVHETLRSVLVPATMVTVKPLRASDTGDSYDPEKNTADLLITLESLANKLENADKDFLKGLIIRTLPNDASKMTRDYSKDDPAFFSTEAMKFISGLGTEHLLVDIPSVDRASDEGKLTAHHIFWNVKQGSNDVDKNKHSFNTITEMIYVPQEVKDGNYLLNLQIAPFAADASPSRPLLFKLQRAKNK